MAAAVDGDRLLSRLSELAEIGADAAGGVTRIAFTELETQANELVIGWLRELDLTVAQDSFGNLFASTDDNAAAGEPWLAGSHIDTVPNGGKLDGALGIVAAVEAVAAMRASDSLPAAPLEVVIWRCEEPVRFAHGKVGSLVFSGALALDELTPLQGSGLDLTMPPTRSELPARRASRGIGGCLELHIEQGRRLERGGHRLGVVTAVASPIRLRTVVLGRGDHSGATPMDDRQDALCAAAELTLAVESAARQEAEAETVATVAQIIVAPGAMNVVPGQAELLIDIRGIDVESMARVVSEIESQGERLVGSRDVRIETQVLSQAEPTEFAPDVIAALALAVKAIGEEPLLLPSGGGHDAQCISALAPSGMLFVPSVGGISHSPLEHTVDEDVVLGARALAAAWATVAGRDGLGR
ncbi:MAG: M20 family metallo-hydrolase [Solirubrobacteraceae bacterium]